MLTCSSPRSAPVASRLFSCSRSITRRIRLLTAGKLAAPDKTIADFIMSAVPNQLSADAAANLPRHVAVIMDGNGRWAKSRHLPRIEGHRRGADSAREIIRTAGELGIKYLTLYAFSAHLRTYHDNSGLSAPSQQGIVQNLQCLPAGELSTVVEDGDLRFAA